MMKQLRRLLPMAGLGAVLIFGLAIQATSDPMPKEQLESYFTRVREAVENVPFVYGEWTGEEVDIPQSAQQLLRPNATISRSYLSSVDGVGVNVLLVHCRDARDMVGHYPPNCYPSQGWTRQDADGFGIELDAPHATYVFRRQQNSFERDIVIYGLFALPQGNLVADMAAVRKSEGNNMERPLGAAQIQLLFDTRVPADRREQAAQEFLDMLQPTIETILNPEATS